MDQAVKVYNNFHLDRVKSYKPGQFFATSAHWIFGEENVL